MWHKSWCATAYSIISPGPNQSSSNTHMLWSVCRVSPVCRKKLVHPGIIINNATSFLQETCCSTRGSFTSWQGAQGVWLSWWCLCPQSHVAAWRGNTSSSQCLQVSGAICCPLGWDSWRTVSGGWGWNNLSINWPQLGGYLFSSQPSLDLVEQKVACS